jgi:hypothetical protein
VTLNWSNNRLGARTARKYERPEAPIQRLMMSPDVTPEQKRALQTGSAELNSKTNWKNSSKLSSANPSR